MQVLYLGRAPRTKETLPDFREKCRVTRHSRVFRRLTGSQRTTGFGASHQGLIEDFIEMSEELSESSDTCVVVFPREKKEEIFPFITEEGSETNVVEEPKKNVLQPIPTELNPTATAQATKCPLPVAPSTDQVYILPSLATQPTPKTPTTKATSIALPVLQNSRN